MFAISLYLWIAIFLIEFASMDLKAERRTRGDLLKSKKPKTTISGMLEFTLPVMGIDPLLSRAIDDARNKTWCSADIFAINSDLQTFKMPVWSHLDNESKAPNDRSACVHPQSERLRIETDEEWRKLARALLARIDALDPEPRLLVIDDLDVICDELLLSRDTDTKEDFMRFREDCYRRLDARILKEEFKA